MARLARLRHRHRRPSRARYLLARLMERAREQGVGVPAMVTHRLHQHHPARAGAVVPGRRGARAPHPRRTSAGTRWRWSTARTTGSTAWAGTSPRSRRRPALYDVGFNHFFRGKGDGGAGDQVFFQGHAAPGVYARAFLEGRLTEEQLDRFRREVDGGGLPELPAPAAHADVLGVPDGVDGPRPAQRGRPGALQPLPACTARWPTRASRRCGRSSATARWTSPRRWPGCRSRHASSSTT